MQATRTANYMSLHQTCYYSIKPTVQTDNIKIKSFKTSPTPPDFSEREREREEKLHSITSNYDKKNFNAKQVIPFICEIIEDTVCMPFKK